MIETVRTWLLARGLGEEAVLWIMRGLGAGGTIVLALAAYLVCKRLLLIGLARLVRRSKITWDDVLLDKKVFVWLARFVPGLVIYRLGPIALSWSEPWAYFVTRAALVYMILIGMLLIDALLSALVEIYRRFDVSRRVPVKGYVQAVKVLFYFVGSILILSVILDKKPWFLLSGLGAFTAILLLIFRDSLLGLVAGIHLTRNDIVRRGDWIEMPKYGADGDVIDVSLMSVKVQNWDKTISTIPTYALMVESFKNWRGMKEAGGRRIKRSIYIDMNSVKFCTEPMLERFSRFQHLADYIARKKAEIAAYNAEHNIDDSVLVNGRRMTNIGTFRAYVEAYLRNHPHIHRGMTLMVRHLQPTEHGLPMEIYAFTRETEWTRYEAIQADIFDHILAVVPQFELRVFQNPTGADFSRLATGVRT